MIPLILVRLFSQSDYGTYQKYITSLLFFSTYFSLGLDQSIMYFISPRISKGNLSLLAYNLIVLLWTILLFGLIHFVHVVFPNMWYFPETISFNITIALLVFNLSSEFVFIALNKYKSYFLFSVLNSLIRVVLLATFLWFDLSLDSAYSFLMWFELIKFCWYISFSLSQTRREDFRVNLEQTKEVLKYSLTMHLANLVGSTGRGIERYMFLGILTANEFAIYGIAMFRIPYLDIVRGSFGSILIADLKQKKKTEANISSRLAIIVYPSVMFALLNANQIIEILFTESYLNVVPYYRLTALSFLLYPLLLAPYFQAFNLRKEFLKAEITTLILGVLSAVILIYLFGLLGGIVSFSLISVSSGLIQLYFLPKMYRDDILSKSLEKSSVMYVLTSVIAVLVVNRLFALVDYSDGSNFWLLIPNALTCVLLTIGLKRYFKCVV